MHNSTVATTVCYYIVYFYIDVFFACKLQFALLQMTVEVSLLVSLRKPVKIIYV